MECKTHLAWSHKEGINETKPTQLEKLEDEEDNKCGISRGKSMDASNLGSISNKLENI